MKRSLRYVPRQPPGGARKAPRRAPLVTTLSGSESREVDGVAIDFVPTSLHCYTIARNLQDQA